MRKLLLRLLTGQARFRRRMNHLSLQCRIMRQTLSNLTFLPHQIKTAVPNWFRRRSFAVLTTSVRFGTWVERRLNRASDYNFAFLCAGSRSQRISEVYIKTPNPLRGSSRKGFIYQRQWNNCFAEAHGPINGNRIEWIACWCWNVRISVWECTTAVLQRQDYRVHTVLKSPCIFLKNP